MAKEQINLVEMADDALRAELTSMQREYAQLKFDHSVKGLPNPMEIKDLRRDIARANTEVRRRELATMTPDALAMRSKIRARRARQK